MTKILIDRSVVEQALKALGTGFSIWESQPISRALQATLDAKPNQVESHQIKTEDDLVQRLRDLGMRESADDVYLAECSTEWEADARIEDLKAERQTYIDLAQKAGSDRAALVACITELEKALDVALEALESIALAGMSGTGQESEEAITEWHASQAWKFIRISAIARDKIKELRHE